MLYVCVIKYVRRGQRNIVKHARRKFGTTTQRKSKLTPQAIVKRHFGHYNSAVKRYTNTRKGVFGQFGFQKRNFSSILGSSHVTQGKWTNKNQITRTTQKRLASNSSKSVSGVKKVAYINTLNEWYDTGILSSWGVPGYVDQNDYNVLNLSFWLTTEGAYDALKPWVDPTTNFAEDTIKKISIDGTTNPDSFRQGLVKLYNDNGIQIMFSCFGATDDGTDQDPVKLGNQIGNFCLENHFNGVDLDWEDSDALETATNTFQGMTGEEWLISITSTIRDVIGPDKIITHAPQAPYFMGTVKYPNGGYLKVQEEVGDKIDWYNVQFYNQGDSTYSTYETLFVASDGWSNNTAVQQMINGDGGFPIPSEKIVVGKPVTPEDAYNTGYVEPNTLKTIFEQGSNSSTTPQWNAGVMTWQFSSDQKQQFQFINTVAPGIRS